MSYQPYPSLRRALRRIVRSHRISRRTERGQVHVEVIVYPGTTSTGTEDELRRLVRQGGSVR